MELTKRACKSSLINRIIFATFAAMAARGKVYFIAGNWKKEADWTRMQPQFRPEFKKLIGNANEWMKPDEYERLENVVAGRFNNRSPKK